MNFLRKFDSENSEAIKKFISQKLTSFFLNTKLVGPKSFLRESCLMVILDIHTQKKLKLKIEFYSHFKFD
jgi:hypothetical protein